MFYICCVNFGIVRVWYCWELWDVRGVNLIMKKCKCGNGIKFIVSLRKSALS